MLSERVDCYFFNSHPHKEDDSTCYTIIYFDTFFNSHPHKEDDQRGFDNQAVMNFSTHILTRRMTTLHIMLHLHLLLFNSHPHKEDD